MNTQSNPMPGSFGSQSLSPAIVSATRPLLWSVRRELWENRSIYLAPLGAAALFLLGFMISLVRLPARMRDAALDPMQQGMFMEQAYEIAATLIMGVTVIVAVFYCLDALHGERRDRSILFWKSLPVSDLTTVLSKACIPIFLLPLITFTITVALWFVMLVLSSVVLLGSGHSVAAASPHVSLFQLSLWLLYHLVAIHGLWYAPFYGWMLLVSAWARRAAFLWATVPLFAIGIVEKIAFGTSHFASVLGYRFGGGGEGTGAKASSLAALLMPEHLTPGHMLMSTGLWTGLAVTAIFLAIAARLRRYRQPL